ncbi:MAG: ATP-binding protein [Candidatus Nanopelagicales bacterium]
MRLQTRLIIAVTLIIAFVALAIGGFAIMRAQTVELNRIDAVLDDAADQLANTTDDPLMLSQFIADESPLPIAMTYLDPDGGVVQISDYDSGLQEAPTPAELGPAVDQPVSIDAPEPVRVRAAALGDADYMLVSTSLAPVISARGDQIRLLSLFTIAMMLIGFAITFIFFRRDGQLANLVQALEQRQRHMQEFLGDASHELRTPLTVIKGYVDLLSQNPITDREKLDRYYARMSTEIDRMEALIRDLLLIAELSENTRRELSDCDLTSALQQQVDDLERLQPEREITTDITADVHLQCVPDLMNQLLANVFSNIRRHTPADCAVDVSLRRRNDEAIITVGDAGSGIPPEALRRGMQYFQRFDDSRSRESGGSGLGMSIMRGIAENTGGTIDLGRSPLGGLEVQITVPLNRR